MVFGGNTYRILGFFHGKQQSGSDAWLHEEDAERHLLKKSGKAEQLKD